MKRSPGQDSIIRLYRTIRDRDRGMKVRYCSHENTDRETEGGILTEGVTILEAKKILTSGHQEIISVRTAAFQRSSIVQLQWHFQGKSRRKLGQVDERGRSLKLSILPKKFSLCYKADISLSWEHPPAPAPANRSTAAGGVAAQSEGGVLRRYWTIFNRVLLKAQMGTFAETADVD